MFVVIIYSYCEGVSTVCLFAMHINMEHSRNK